MTYKDAVKRIEQPAPAAATSDSLHTNRLQALLLAKRSGFGKGGNQFPKRVSVHVAAGSLA
jgi:hypothetical protein